MQLDAQRDEMIKHMHSSLDGLKLDDHHTIGYTFKALGCGFYGLREGGPKNFKKMDNGLVFILILKYLTK